MKKNIMIGFIAVMMLFAVAGFVNAAASLSIPGSVTLGATSNQERNQSITSEFTITNNGDVNLTNLIVSSNADARYNISFSLDNSNFASTKTITNLGINGTQTVYVRGAIPQNEASGTNKDIGDITFSNSQISAATITAFYINPISKLEIRAVKLYYSDEDDGVSKGNTASFDYDGSRNLKIDFDLKNNFPSGDDNYIDYTDVQITIDNLDTDGDDLTDDLSVSTVKKTITKSFSFVIDDQVAEGSYRILIEATSGIDQNGASHSYTWDGNVRFNRESHKVIITSASLSPSSLKCTRQTTVSVTVLNIGQDDEDHAAIAINSSSLGISAGQDFSIDSNSDSSSGRKTFSFPIAIKDVVPGKYIIGVNAYSINSLPADSYQALELTVEPCTGDVITTPPNNNQNTITQPPKQTNTTIIQYITAPATDNTQNGQIVATPVGNNGLFQDKTVLFLAIGVLIVMVLIIVLLLKLIK
ncbi:MAG: hypothetical protein Q8O89_03520 [Nanoarchaeota archaeon]|nr:hypothetical protein [Nanoarchaeota archaeon]